MRPHRYRSRTERRTLRYLVRTSSVAASPPGGYGCKIKGTRPVLSTARCIRYITTIFFDAIFFDYYSKNTVYWRHVSALSLFRATDRRDVFTLFDTLWTERASTFFLYTHTYIRRSRDEYFCLKISSRQSTTTPIVTRTTTI